LAQNHLKWRSWKRKLRKKKLGFVFPNVLEAIIFHNISFLCLLNMLKTQISSKKRRKKKNNCFFFLGNLILNYCLLQWKWNMSLDYIQLYHLWSPRDNFTTVSKWFLVKTKRINILKDTIYILFNYLLNYICLLSQQKSAPKPHLELQISSLKKKKNYRFLCFIYFINKSKTK